MEGNKRNSHLVFYILLFIVAVFFELYWINTRPYDYFMIIGIGLIVLITAFLTFDGIIKAISEAEERRREQNETMIKAQKAIYLATKKNASEAENMQVQNLKAVNMLMDRMVETLTERQIETSAGKTADPMDLSGLINEMTASNAKLAKEIQNAVTVNQLVKANEDLIKNVQNVLSGQAVDLSSTKAITAPVQPAPVVVPTPEPVVIPEPQPVITPEPEPVITPEPEPVVIPEPQPVITPTPEPVVIPEPEPVIIPEPEPASVPDTITDASSEDDDDTINIDNMTLEELDEMDFIENDIADAEAAVADASQTMEAIEATNELEETLVGEDVTESMDNDDTLAVAASAMEKGPNDALTPEEIAALFANL